MSHELAQNAEGKDSFAQVGTMQAWHGLGQSLSEGASIETWKKEAGLDWDIKCSPVMYHAKSIETPETKGLDLVETLSMPGRKLCYRSDNNAALSVVGSKFKIVQPGETLEFYRDLIETAGFSLETAGALFGGRKFWALARCGASISVLGVDEVKPYLLLASACDGSMSTVAHFTTVRVVCNNTLQMALGGSSGSAIRVPHSADFDPKVVKEELGVVSELWESFDEAANILAKFRINREDAIQIVAKELKVVQKGEKQLFGDELLAESLSLRSIINLFDGAGMGADKKSTKGTAWGLLNAVTEHFDHQAGSKSSDKSRAFERAHLTDRAQVKVRIANSLLSTIS